MTEPTADAPDPALAAVQRAALERALLDEGDDSRRHLALAGALDVARPEGAEPSTGVSADVGATSVLPSALLCLLAVSALDRVAPARVDRTGPAVPATVWQPSTDGYDRCLRRGARLALDHADVDPERIAAIAGVPASELVTGSSDRAKNSKNE